MNNQVFTKLKQYFQTLHLRIVLAALVFALAYGYSQYEEVPQEEPADGTGSSLGFDDLYPEQAKQALDLKTQQDKQIKK